MDSKLIRMALRENSPSQALRSLVLQFAAAGNTRAQIIALFESFLADLRSKDVDDESAEDLILDTLDALHGWCHPSARLLSENPG